MTLSNQFSIVQQLYRIAVDHEPSSSAGATDARDGSDIIHVHVHVLHPSMNLYGVRSITPYLQK